MGDLFTTLEAMQLLHSADQAVAVVLGLSPTGLYVVRELGRAGIPVVGVSAELQCGGWSRYLQGSIREPSEDLRLAKLMRFGEEASRQSVLIAASDQDIDFVIRHAKSLSQYFKIQASYLDGVAERLMTKSSLYQLSSKFGIPTPRYVEVDRDEIQLRMNDLTYPCLIKPSRIDAVKREMAGRKLWILRTPSELLDLESSLPVGDTTWILQELIPGPESEITLYASHFDADGEPRQAITCRKLRQFPPGFGSASLVRSKLETETRSVSEAFLKHVGYRGIVATEFKRDPRDGKLKLIEINPRPSLWFSVTSAARKSISLAAYRDMSGLTPLNEECQTDDVEWRYGPKDMYSNIFYRWSKTFPLPRPDLDSLAAPARRVYPVLAPDDPLPALEEVFGFARKIVSRAVRKRPTK